MNQWSDLTAAALLGTGRSAVSASLPGRLDELLATDAPAEEGLLRAAGILATAQLAALTVNPSAEAAPAPALPETAMPVTEPEGVALLARIIEKGQTSLLAEACRLLAGRGRCLPPRVLPRVLELGRQSTALREPLRQALGQRGAWLAVQNPDWKFAALANVDLDEPRIWDEGDARQRAAYLRRLRLSDPAEARRLLEAAFAGETARDRALLLPALAENLGAEDEAFLAATLAGDRSKEVRGLAAGLLSRLPESAFAQRMIARLDACIRQERKRARLLTVIEPPLAFPADWKADALEEPPPAQAKFGERAWWLLQLVSYAPLRWWPGKLQLEPDGVLALAAKSEWKSALLAGLRTALSRQPGHSDWTAALLKHGGFSHQQAVQLALTLTPTEADAALQQILAETDDAGLAAQIIESADFPWSVALWRIAQQKLPRWLAAHDWRLRTALSQLACRIPPSALGEDPVWPEAPLFADALAECAAILEQRRALHQQFQALGGCPG